MVSSSSSSWVIFNLLSSLLMTHGRLLGQGDVYEDHETTYKEHVLKNCKPRHVHISFGDEIVDMKVMWATVEKCDDCEVLYGIAQSFLDQKASTNYTNFVEHNKRGLQHLLMSDLKNLHPDTTYFYTPVCENQFSGPFSFHVPPVSTDWVAKYLVFGDMGMQTESLETVIQEAKSGNYTALFHAGDFAYNFHDKGGTVGDEFMEMIEPATSHLPYMTSPGNHEIYEGRFSHYSHRFAMPDSDWPIPVDKMWYSFDVGPVHFISYSSEVFFTNNGKYVKTQKAWLLDDFALANSRRNVTPWVVAFGHRPLYCSTRIGDDCSQILSFVREGLEEIFYEMKVDLILQAHEHNYERLWPMYQGLITDFSYTNVKAPIQIITGAAGSHFGTDHFVKGDRPAWSAFRMGQPALNSYGQMVVYNDTHIYWEQRSALDHTLIDSIWIIKDSLFERNASIPFIALSQRDHNFMIVITVAGFCVSVIIAALVIRYVFQIIRKKRFRNTWHLPLKQNEDSDDEEEEFFQDKYDNSLF